MEILKDFIHKGGEESESRVEIKGSCALITLHKSTFDRCKVRRVNPDMRSCSTFSVRVSRLSTHSCSYPSLCDVFVSVKSVQAVIKLALIQDVVAYKRPGNLF